MPTPKPRRKPTPISPIEDEEVDLLSSNLLVFEQEVTLDNSQLAISISKPEVLNVSRARYEQLYGQLHAQFNSPQVRSYVNWVRQKQKKEEISKKTSKRAMLKVILMEIWGVRIDEEKPEIEDVVVKKKLVLSREDIYFLIGQSKCIFGVVVLVKGGYVANWGMGTDGKNLRMWAQQYHARITVNIQESEVTFQAVQGSIDELEKRVPEVLKEKIYQDIDLSALTRFASFNRANMSTISTLTETYIHPLGDDLVCPPPPQAKSC